jgi:hypothetical protein
LTGSRVRRRRHWIVLLLLITGAVVWYVRSRWSRAMTPAAPVVSSAPVQRTEPPRPVPTPAAVPGPVAVEAAPPVEDRAPVEPASPVEKPARQVEKPAPRSGKPAPKAAKPARHVEKPAPKAAKPARQVEKPVPQAVPAELATPQRMRAVARVDNGTPFGPGSARSLPDGSAPGPEYQIKGNTSSMLFHTPTSPYYKRTKPEVWFRTAEDARAAGFTEWTPRRRTSG